jgi:predicted amidophosphoribosyltransferase
MPLRTRIECPACHHDLLVKRGGKCPNCGARISEHVARVRARERRIEQVVAIIGSLLVLEGVMVYAAVGAVMFYLARKTFS